MAVKPIKNYKKKNLMLFISDLQIIHIKIQIYFFEKNKINLTVSQKVFFHTYC